MKILLIIIQFILLGLLFTTRTQCELYYVNPLNYTEYVKSLNPGDTVFFDKGTYTQALKLVGVNGSPEKPIALIGADGGQSVFLGKDGVNTISITKCSYLTIKDFKIDGQNLPVDALKAEGTAGNYAHHISLEDLYIINFGNDQQIVGISTKCPAWDWIIRRCTIIGAGTGLYLGNSDGTMPFVNGLIEHNLIMNTIGYNMQIKHQKENLRTVPGMTLNGKTIIRYNVFSKAEGGAGGNSARPCLLVGNFPATGDGANDYYEIYGNFFWQNPTEALFQGTGNIALYNNIFVNNSNPAGYRAVYIAQQNSFKPRTIDVFHNTVWTNNESGGIRMFSADTNYRQTCVGNAAFGPNPISNFRTSYKNITAGYDSCSAFLINPNVDISMLSMFPKASMLTSDTVDMSRFSKYTDYDLDFDGNYYNTIYRGAYSGDGIHSGWKLALEIRPKPGAPAYAFEEIGALQGSCLFPNPASDYIEINVPRWRGQWVDNSASIHIFDILGTKITSPSLRATPPYQGGEKVRIDVSGLAPGVYFVQVSDVVRKFVKM